MKPGDLVRIKSTTWLYGGDTQAWDEWDNFIPTDIPAEFNTTAMIISKIMDKRYRIYLKILTPLGGVGWLHESFLEVLQ